MRPVPPRESPPFPIADAAEDDLRRRRRLLTSLERVERELRRSDAWETNALLPEELQRPDVRPRLHREALDSVQRMLTEELVRLDGLHSGA
jgi:hypothetical protein